MASRADMEAKNGSELMARRKPASPQKKIANIDKIIEALSSVDIGSLNQPDAQEVFNEKGVGDTVDEILKIIRMYEEKGVAGRIGHLDEDVIRLGALLTTLSMHCSHASVNAFHSEENLKYPDAAIYAKVNAYAHENNIHIVGADYTNISRIHTKEERERRVATQAFDRMLSGIYFTARQFMLTLSGLAPRYPV